MNRDYCTTFFKSLLISCFCCLLESQFRTWYKGSYITKKSFLRRYFPSKMPIVPEVDQCPWLCSSYPICSFWNWVPFLLCQRFHLQGFLTSSKASGKYRLPWHDHKSIDGNMHASPFDTFSQSIGPKPSQWPPLLLHYSKVYPTFCGYFSKFRLIEKRLLEGKPWTTKADHHRCPPNFST